MIFPDKMLKYILFFQTNYPTATFFHYVNSRIFFFVVNRTYCIDMKDKLNFLDFEMKQVERGWTPVETDLTE